jgi:hypothetical protein
MLQVYSMKTGQGNMLQALQHYIYGIDSKKTWCYYRASSLALCRQI